MYSNLNNSYPTIESESGKCNTGSITARSEVWLTSPNLDNVHIAQPCAGASATVGDRRIETSSRNLESESLERRCEGVQT